MTVARSTGVPGIKTVARRHGVILSGGMFRAARVGPWVCRFAARQALSDLGAVTARSSMPGGFCPPLYTATIVCCRIRSPSRTTPSPLLTSSRRKTAVPVAHPYETLGRRIPRHRAGRRHGSRSGELRSGIVLHPTNLSSIQVNPSMSRCRIPGPAVAYPWVMRARKWRNRKHDEPVLRCDCDLRFSFP